MPKNKVVDRKIPFDYWNHGINPITGWTVLKVINQSGGIKLVYKNSSPTVFKNFQI